MQSIPVGWFVALIAIVATVMEMVAIQSAWSAEARAELHVHSWTLTPFAATVVGDSAPYHVRWEVATPNGNCYVLDDYQYDDVVIAQHAADRRLNQTVFDASGCSRVVDNAHCMTHSDWSRCRKDAAVPSVIVAAMCWIPLVMLQCLCLFVCGDAVVRKIDETWIYGPVEADVEIPVACVVEEPSAPPIECDVVQL